MSEQDIELTPEELQAAQGLNISPEELNRQMREAMKRFPLVPPSEFQVLVKGLLVDTAAQQLQEQVTQPVDTQIYIDTVSKFIRELLLHWATMKLDLDLDKAAPIVAQALQNRGRSRPKESIRQAAEYVLNRIKRKELNRFL